MVHILTKPPPPHSIHFPSTPLPLRNLDVEKRLVFTHPLPKHAAHLESYFITIRGTCVHGIGRSCMVTGWEGIFGLTEQVSLEASQFVSSSVDFLKRRPLAHMFPVGWEIGRGSPLSWLRELRSAELILTAMLHPRIHLAC